MKKQISILSAMCLALLSGGATSAFANSATQPQLDGTDTAATNIDNPQAYSFVTLTFHDVRDDVKKRGDRDVYAISTKNFAQFLAWIKTNGWQPIRLEDVWQARQLKKPLPEKAVLITVDDGALSGYTKIFPLLKLHQVPAVFAIPTSWINGNTQAAYEAYGSGNLMNWDQMREIQRSGLVEFVSHSDNLHYGILSNPQQNKQPAAITRLYDEKTKSYESDAAYKQRILADLKRSKQVLEKELGVESRAIFWPYGAATKETEEIAIEAGFPMSFSLGSVLTLADAENTYQRALIMDNPTPEVIHEGMREFLTYTRAPYKQRKSILRYDLADMAAVSYDQADQKLGQLLNQVNALKTNTLLLKVVADSNADGKVDVAYFPNRQLKMQQDLLNRTVWQARTRVGHRVYAELPLSLQTQQGYSLADFTTDLVKNNSSIGGLMLDTGSSLNCALAQEKWTAECQTAVQQIIDIKNQTKKASKYYADISNNYQTALKVDGNQTSFKGLKQVIQLIPDHADFIYISIDPVQSASHFSDLKHAIAHLNKQERQHLMVTFEVNPQATAHQWQHYQDAYAVLRQLSIQKLGIENYHVNMGEQVHQHLYTSLSLNESPLEYRDPFQTKIAH